MESSSFSGSSKRAKTPVHMTHVTHCSVDGCIADLSLCRDYHRRHKVCEIHSKTPTVIVGGREQRFCQQCSRFHSLVEFDEGKRSCRKRLDGHNRRRRKPQSDYLSRNSGYVFAAEEGGHLLSFGSSQILPSAVVSSSWNAIIKPKINPILHNKSQLHDYTESYKRENQQIQSMPQTSLIDHRSNQADRALSLLSSASTISAAPNFSYNNGLGQLVPGNRSFETYGCPVSSNFMEMFHQGHEGSSTDITSNHGLTFTWE